MLNFLPKKEAKIAQGHYRQRLFAIFGLALSISVAVYGLAVIPATVAAWQAADDIDGKAQALRESADNQQFSDTLLAAQSLRVNSDSLAPVLAPSTISALESVLTKGRATIAISSIDIRRLATSSVVVTVSGVAATREDLLSFASDLDKDPNIQAALPVSDLAREKSAPFSIDAVVGTETQ